MKDFMELNLTKEEQAFLDRLHVLCRETIVPVRAELDAGNTPPAEVFDVFRANDVFRAFHGKKYGGLGMSPMMSWHISKVIAEYCLGVLSSLGISTFLAPLVVKLAGNAEQKEKYLPRLVSGEWLGAFAMTEEEAGSDIANLSTKAVKKGDHYILNGTKKWITNAGWADVHFIFAVSNSERDPRGGVSCFAVEKGTPGLSFGPLEDKLGLRCAPNRPIILEDVEVHERNLIGKPDRGFLLALDCLTRSRANLGAASVGLATGAYKEAARYARNRRQFKKRLIDIPGVQTMLAEILVRIEAAEALAYKAGWYTHVLKRRDAHKYAAMAKYFCSETAMQVATDALQLHGGRGFIKQSPVEKMFRDAKILAIYEGTSQMMKNQIAASIMTESARY